MSVVLAKFTLLCVLLFVTGYALSALLFARRGLQLRGSSLQLKIHTWIPIFAAVLIMAWGGRWATAAVLLAAALGICVDYAGRLSSLKGAAAPVHGVLILTGLGALYFLASGDATRLLAVWFLSVMSDVTAYFAGNFAGKHHLPEIFNRHKSWEGVMGQIAGAGIGFGMFLWVGALPFWLWLAVGLGSAVGDMMNSFVKRAGGFKDWSQNIPGHGGFVDRLSSLSYAAIIVVLLLRT